MDRTTFIGAFSALGFGATLMPGLVWAQTSGKAPVTRDMIESAAKIADVPIAEEQTAALLESLTSNTAGYDAIYALHLPNDVAPAFDFNPVPHGMTLQTAHGARAMSALAPASVHAPPNIEDLAFAPVRILAELVRTRQVSSLALTQMYLARLKRYDPQLKFVITLTEERALAQARRADREIAAGSYRGPLHGLPWGAKDLLAVKGYKTTWGAGGFEAQTIDTDATVVQRLDAAGAVLVAKLTLGALAQGDKWYGGQTRNPWNPRQGSSGSSAGPASATAAGCIAFAIGSETLGSISSPSTRCGTTGLRPSFGLVPRTGAMALSWTMDKLGPICRAVEDCALVLEAIYGPDGADRSVKDAAFDWNAALDWRTLRVGYLKSDFAYDGPALPAGPQGDPKGEIATARARRRYEKTYEEAALAKLRAMGANMTPLELPKLPYGAMRAILVAEAAAAFDDLTRSGRDKLLTEQGPSDWPATFRAARFIPAVEYIQASRARMLAIDAMAKLFADVDVIVAPTGSTQLLVTNLTGHPAVILPNGFRGDDAPPARVLPSGEQESGGPGTPVSLTFLGNLYGEAKLLTFAKAYQDATAFHLQHPAL